MNLNTLDLNLLRAFDAIMRERNVSRAAERIFMSQPALSNALKRLRHSLKDELFIRSPKGMRPTPRALELAVPIRAALATLEDAFADAQFEPANAVRTFRLLTHDYVAAVLLPPLIVRLQQEAPGVDLRVYPMAGRALDSLDEQEADFAISAFDELPERFDFVKLCEEDYVCLMRSTHPLAKNMALRSYASANHLLVSPKGDPRGFVDQKLMELGLTRRIALCVNQFSVAPALLKNSDLIATLPRRIAEQYAAQFGLTTLPCPVTIPTVFTRLLLVWHSRLGVHPANVWFRELFERVTNEVYGARA